MPLPESSLFKVFGALLLGDAVSHRLYLHELPVFALLFEQLVGNASFRNTQGNSLGYRGFSDAAFADKSGVVLSPAEEDLFCLGYFAVAAENGVDLALSRERSQIFSVFFESCPRFKRL